MLFFQTTDMNIMFRNAQTLCFIGNQGSGGDIQ